jgi:hypothetical protein
LRVDVSDQHQVRWPDSERDAEETEAASPDSCDNFQLDPNVAGVYLSVIREGEGMALLQGKFSRESRWPDRLAVGEYFLPILGIGSVYRRRIRSSRGYFLYGRWEL